MRRSHPVLLFVAHLPPPQDSCKLAIVVEAHSYISRDHCTLKEYPTVRERQRKRLLTFPPSQAQSRYGDVYATFEASAEILPSSNTESADDTLQLLPILYALATIQPPLLVF